MSINWKKIGLFAGGTLFGTKEIKEILDCSPSTARAVMTKLRDMKVVKAVNGKGKGKYVFIE